VSHGPEVGPVLVSSKCTESDACWEVVIIPTISVMAGLRAFHAHSPRAVKTQDCPASYSHANVYVDGNESKEY
jgi:hypothetical protein